MLYFAEELLLSVVDESHKKMTGQRQRKSLALPVTEKNQVSRVLELLWRQKPKPLVGLHSLFSTS